MNNLRESLYQTIEHKITATDKSTIKLFEVKDSEVFDINTYLTFSVGGNTSAISIELTSALVGDTNLFHIGFAQLKNKINFFKVVNNIVSYYMELVGDDVFTDEVTVRKEIKFGVIENLLSEAVDNVSNNKVNIILLDSWETINNVGNGTGTTLIDTMAVNSLSPKGKDFTSTIGTVENPYKEIHGDEIYGNLTGNFSGKLDKSLGFADNTSTKLTYNNLNDLTIKFVGDGNNINVDVNKDNENKTIEVKASHKKHNSTVTQGTSGNINIFNENNEFKTQVVSTDVDGHVTGITENTFNIAQVKVDSDGLEKNNDNEISLKLGDKSKPTNSTGQVLDLFYDNSTEKLQVKPEIASTSKFGLIKSGTTGTEVVISEDGVGSIDTYTSSKIDNDISAAKAAVQDNVDALELTVDGINVRVETLDTNKLNKIIADSTPLLNNNILIGTGTTVKDSGKKITTSVGEDDTTVPTSKAVKTYVDSIEDALEENINTKLSKVYTVKGSVEDYEDLPKNNAIGDVYNVRNAHGNIPAGTNWVWVDKKDGELIWDPLGGTVDLEPYAKSEDKANTLVEDDNSNNNTILVGNMVNTREIKVSNKSIVDEINDEDDSSERITKVPTNQAIVTYVSEKIAEVSSGEIELSGYATETYVATAIGKKQDTLTAGQNIKMTKSDNTTTIDTKVDLDTLASKNELSAATKNIVKTEKDSTTLTSGKLVLGAGSKLIKESSFEVSDDTLSDSHTTIPTSHAIKEELDIKQNKLIDNPKAGEVQNIKKINGESLFGTGDITIRGADYITLDQFSITELEPEQLLPVIKYLVNNNLNGFYQIESNGFYGRIQPYTKDVTGKLIYVVSDVVPITPQATDENGIPISMKLNFLVDLNNDTIVSNMYYENGIVTRPWGTGNSNHDSLIYDRVIIGLGGNGIGSSDINIADVVTTVDGKISEDIIPDTIARQEALESLQENLEIEIDTRLSIVYKYMGSVDTYLLLESTGIKEKGNVYNVVQSNGNTPAGTNYAWNGSAWDALGGTVDLSNYITHNPALTDNDLVVVGNGKTTKPGSKKLSDLALKNDVKITGDMGDTNTILVGMQGDYAGTASGKTIVDTYTSADTDTILKNKVPTNFVLKTELAKKSDNHGHPYVKLSGDTMTGDLNIGSTTNETTKKSLSVSKNLTVAGTSTLTGATTLSSTLNVSGLASLNGGIKTGDQSINIGGGSIQFSSDERLKDIHEDITLETPNWITDTIKNTHIYNYNFKGQENKKIGLIAQRLEENVTPELKEFFVHTGPEGELEDKKSIDPNALIFLLWAEVQRLQQVVGDLQEKVK